MRVKDGHPSQTGDGTYGQAPPSRTGSGSKGSRNSSRLFPTDYSKSDQTGKSETGQVRIVGYPSETPVLIRCSFRSASPSTLLILDTLVREFEERGVTILPVSDEKLSRLTVGSEHVRFYIREQSKRTKEKGSYFDVYSPKGMLSFVIDEYPSRAWHDGKEQRIEDLLGEIVAGMPQQGEVLRVQRLEREEWHRRWEEEQRLRELQEKALKKERLRSVTFVLRSRSGISAK
jgi:hypothetical protein